ncbi:hypothetical protein NLG97_g1315 [Lecanicillium saksenae]|uniref:Uncharacterized protein n=1 Tax=Lecanicillium saksenae TaxID=468837 RepID=A0ACC1R7E2_9HYPO|nr:hypothetical protein NLG97_g1315 [Lecanicillium saksenae]
MLDSFEGDDADSDVDSAAAVATIRWGQAVAQEDDILLWSLSSVLDLHELGLASSHELGIAGPPASMAEMAPIFAPSSFDGIEEKIKSGISHLSHLHDQLLARDPSYQGNFDQDLVKSALSARTAIMFSVTYFQQSHRYISLVHRPSFGSQDTSTTLLLAVAFAGSTRSPPKDDVLCVRNLARLLEEFVFQQLEHLIVKENLMNRSRELLETLAAAILVYQVQFMSMAPVTLQRMRTSRLPALISAARKMDLFTTRHEADTDWLQFIETESCIRMAYWTAMADWNQTILLHMPPQVSVREMMANMPCSLDMWNATNAGDFVALLRDQACKQKGTCVPQSIETSADEQLGLGSVVISADVSLTMPQMATSLLNAVLRWQSLWQENLRTLSGKAINKGGIEKYSDEYACIIQTLINVISSREPRPSYLVGIGHNTVTEFHEFLVQYCQDFTQ